MVREVGPLSAGRPRPALVAEVRANLAHLPHDATVVVACSGGPDSSALAHLTSEARPDLSLVLVHVAHGLRERAAELADRQVASTHASWLGAEFVARDLRVVTAGRGAEAAARDARYLALREVAAQRSTHAILVGHTADDQAETVLLRVARGTGIDGLAAMSIRSEDLVRPLLRIRRADLHGFVVGEGLPVATDETNEDPAIRRVRVRDEVLPTLQRVGPDPVGTLARLAELARDDAAALAVAAEALPDAIRRIGPVVALRSEVLRTAPVALARRVVRTALATLVEEPPSAATVARILQTPVGGGATLPGGIALRVERAWRTLVAVDADDRDGHRVGVGTVALTAAAPVLWRSAGLGLRVLVAGLDERPEPPPAGAAPVADQIALAIPGAWTPPQHPVDTRVTAPGTLSERYAVVLPEPVAGLEVRSLVAGDRIRGPAGTRRAAEVLRDAGMPRAVRTRWPAVVCEGRLVWIPGVAVDANLSAAGRRAPALAVQATPM